MKYKLKDGVDFKWVNEKSKMKYDFNLADYYDENITIERKLQIKKNME